MSTVDKKAPSGPLHFMLDLETLDTRPSAAVLSIGLVGFYPFGVDAPMPIGERWVLDVDAQLARGATVSGSTLCWWAQQSDAARHDWARASQLSPEYVLTVLRNIVDCEYACVWAHVAAFDFPILDMLASRFGLKPLFDFRKMRDTRTLFQLLSLAPGRTQGVAHNPLDDAAAQARVVVDALHLLRARGIVGYVT
jgi:hypothetical protein